LLRHAGEHRWQFFLAARDIDDVACMAARTVDAPVCTPCCTS
jgi:hypothetical protein